MSLLFSGVNLYRSFDTGQVAVDLKDIVVENNGEYIRWKVKGSQDWNNLIAVKTLTGGSDKKVEVKNEDGKLIWRYSDEGEWTTLMDLSNLTVGVAGRDGKDGSRGKAGQQGADGKDGLAGKKGLDGAKGADGLMGATGAAGPAGATGPAGQDANVYEDLGVVNVYDLTAAATYVCTEEGLRVVYQLSAYQSQGEWQHDGVWTDKFMTQQEMGEQILDNDYILLGRYRLQRENYAPSVQEYLKNSLISVRYLSH